MQNLTVIPKINFIFSCNLYSFLVIPTQSQFFYYYLKPMSPYPQAVCLLKTEGDPRTWVYYYHFFLDNSG